MAKQSPTLYSVAKTFFWFAVVSILLTACLAGIVYTDYKREWKNYQKKFVQLKLQKAKEELKQASESVDKTELTRLQTALKQAQADADARRPQTVRLQKEIAGLETPLAKAKDKYQSLKQFLDSDRYFFEEYTEKKDRRAAEYGKKVAGWTPKVTAAKAAQDGLEKEKEAKEARLAEFGAKEKEARFRRRWSSTVRIVGATRSG